MLCPGVIREWVGEGELLKERTQLEVAEAIRCENRIDASPATRWSRLCMGVAICLSIDQGKLLREHRSVKQAIERGEEATMSSEGLSYPKANRRSERRWTRRSATVPQKRIYQSRRKGYRCKATNSRAMGLVAPWYRRGRTSVESSIRCSHGGRVLVMKGVEEVENAKANSKYQDKAEEQRPENFIRPMSTGFSSR
ncbi:hypothetical protein BHE74_00011073 [Ensete ventricosum]|nr:hypothetical protein GW17_00011107 [Ensete ventricosum]RWW80579.1 hypothetical protein BHE74_00011073 [Ensete ventricosum]RZR90246.1 hypothetical protein BHM03_00018098 [Ensete ventricosum]